MINWHEHHHHHNSQFDHRMHLQTAICGAEHCPEHQLRGQPWSCWHSGDTAWLSGRPSCSCYLVNFILSDHWKDGLHFSRSNRFGNNSTYVWPILLDINSIVKSSREGDYVHRRLWWTSHGPAVREVIILIIIGVTRTIRWLPVMLSSTTLVYLVTSLSPTTKQILIISSSFGSIPINQIINLNHNSQPEPQPTHNQVRPGRSNLLLPRWLRVSFSKCIFKVIFTTPTLSHKPNSLSFSIKSRIESSNYIRHVFFTSDFFFRVSAFLEWIAVAMQDFGSVQ